MSAPHALRNLAPPLLTSRAHALLIASLMSLLSLLSSMGCSDSYVVPVDGGTEISEEEPLPTDCPPEFLREDGVCLISDIEGYYAMMQENGEITDEDLLNIDNSDLEEQQRTFLAQEGRGKFYVYLNESKRIGVRVINNVGVPVPGMNVAFSFSMDGTSDPRGTTLSAMNATTDNFGVAAIEVNAGSDPTYFQLNMESEDGSALLYSINVIQPNIADTGDLEVLPPSQRCNLFLVEGTYDVDNSYELARFLGDGVFETLRTINRALSDPGGLIGDWIRDRIGGLVGDVVRGVVREVINFLFRGLNLPAWAQTTADIIQDVTDILTNLQIQGNIRLGSAQGDDCYVPGVHTWEELAFTWQGGQCGGFGNNDPNCGAYRVSLAEVGVSASETEFEGNIENQTPVSMDLAIHEHRLDLNLGVIALTILQDLILPQRANVRSIGELIAQIMPCQEFGNAAASIVGFIPFVSGSVARIAADACRNGITALGNDLTRRLVGQLEVSTFKVKGRARLVSDDQDPEIERLSEGRWEGDPDDNSFLQGDFEGTRRE